MKKRLFKKSFRDLFNNRRKSFIAILSIIVGMISFGTLLFSYEIITNELINTYSSTNPPSASINVDHIDNNLLKLTEDFSKISDYEIKTCYQMRGQKANGEWVSVELFASDDYTKININKIFHIDGQTNPKNNEMLIERDAINVCEKNLGETLLLSLPNGSEKELKITGVINDLSVHPATMHNTIYAYVSMDTLKDMGLSPNRIDFKLNGNVYNREKIMTVSNEYTNMLEENGYKIKGLDVANTPGVSMHLEEYKTTLFLLRSFAFIAFLFGCLIMSSLITSILSQQIKQIGILKSFGTSTKTIISYYLLALFSFIGLAGIISLPISKTLANLLSALLLRISNMSLNNTAVSPLLYVIFLAFCLIAPLLIAFYSIHKSTKTSIKDAINNSSLNKNYLLKPLKTKFTWLQRPVLLTIRNAFRRKGRFCLNVITLTITGVCFITILVSMISVNTTLKDNLNTFSYDYHFIINNTDEIKVNDILDKNLEVKNFEYWSYNTGKLINKKGEIDNSFPIFAVEKNSKLLSPDLLEGSWLKGNNTNEIVVSHEFIQNSSNTKLGSNINLEIGGVKISCHIIGVIKDFSGKNVYMNKDFYNKKIISPIKQEVVQLKLNSSLKGRAKNKLINKIENSILNKDISILQSESKDNAIKVLSSHYNATFQTFLIIIVMVLIISAFGLSSTNNIQTLERIKEIGIMKSMGASKKQIIKIITSESVFVGLCSWILSALLSIPALTFSLTYFSKITLKSSININWLSVFAGYIIWLLIIIFIGKRASKHSALRSANMTIRETLL